MTIVVPRRAAVVLLLAACAGLAAACDATPNRFPLDFERMRDQPRYQPYDRSAFFPDGKTMRTPPAGTVPMERTTGPTAFVDGRTGNTPVDAIPGSVTLAAIERGRNRYDVFCAACHGLDGTGDTPVAANMQLRRPPSLHEARIRQLAPGAIFGVVSRGYGLMPSYAHQLTTQDRWNVVAYVRALQLSRNAALDALPPAVRSEADAALERTGRD